MRFPMQKPAAKGVQHPLMADKGTKESHETKEGKGKNELFHHLIVAAKVASVVKVEAPKEKEVGGTARVFTLTPKPKPVMKKEKEDSTGPVVEENSRHHRPKQEKEAAIDLAISFSSLFHEKKEIPPADASPKQETTERFTLSRVHHVERLKSLKEDKVLVQIKQVVKTVAEVLKPEKGGSLPVSLPKKNEKEMAPVAWVEAPPPKWSGTSPSPVAMSVEGLKLELPKEIRQLVDFQLITPKKITMQLDRSLGAAEIRLERVDGVIMVDVRVDDIKTKDRIEQVLRDLRDDLGMKGMDVKYDVREEDRRQEKRKEDPLYEEKRQNRERRNQEEQKHGHQRN